MLTPKQLQEIVETMQPLLDDLNVWITKDIIRRIVARMSRGEDWSFGATDISQAQVYRDLGGHFEALQRQLMAFTQAAEDEVRKIFQYTGLTAYDADAEMYRQGGLDVPPLRQSPRILQILEDTYRRTNGEIRNFTRTTANASQQRLIQTLDLAHIKVMSGATSYAVAVRDAVNELASHQAYVRYPTGHTDTLEVAVLRAVRTGTAQASGNMSIGTMEQYGWEIVLTSAHLGARYGDGGENPGNHFWWQGRFFSRTGKDKRFPPFIESTGYGTGEGLCGWNCRHSFGPGDGVHNPWTQYDAQANKEAYDLSQMQRKKERDIRSQTKKVEAFKEAVAAAQSDDVRKAMQEALKEEQGKLTSLRKDYGNFCNENGLKRQAFRLEVAKVKQQEAEKTYYSQPATDSGLTGAENGGTMTSDSDTIWYPITQESINSVPQFTEFGAPEMNESVHEACVEILNDLKDTMVGTEESISLPLSGASQEKVPGGEGEGMVRIADMKEPYIALHNHPSNGTFSYRDIDLFGDRNSCIGAVVIGNNGKNAYLMLKTDKFDFAEFLKYRLERKYGFTHYDSIEEFLMGAEKHGVRYIERHG